MLPVEREVVRSSGLTWDEEDDFDLVDEPISEPQADICGGVTTWDFQAGSTLGNTSTAEIDYRTLAPKKLTDPNLNSAEAITDPLGMVIATSVYGTENTGPRGDTPLSSYTVVVPTSLRHVVDNPHTYLQGATTFFYYDLGAWHDRDEPPQAIGLAREKHVSDLSSGELPEVQKTVTYSDGFGREIQTKLWVEPGEAWVKQPDNTYAEQEVTERWLSSGRTVFNNKEKPVKQYEPFYTDTHEYQPEEFFAEYGVTPIIHYDPLLRVIETKSPRYRQEVGGEIEIYHVHSKVEFTPWEVKTWDFNDTITDSEYWGIKGDLDPQEQAALDKAAVHADTPGIALLDSLGRQFITKQLLDPTTELDTITTFDITGKPLTVTDPRGNVAFQYTYDMVGNALRTVNIDAGDDRVLVNVMGNPVKSFDSKGHVITAEYDVLHRPVKKAVAGDGLDNVVERLVYGEDVEDATDKNLKGRLFQHFDQAGRLRVPFYDLHGQVGRTQRRLRTQYKAEANWPDSGGWNGQLETETFQTTYRYDALTRTVQVNHPDGSRVRPLFHQSGRLRRVRVMAEGETTWSNYVVNVKYSAKSQRETIIYGNSTRTDYRYDPATFRLEYLRTKRTGDDVVLQDIRYVYDPVGNIVRIRDDSHQRVLTNNQSVEPRQNYTYDALYRLTAATGREHPALNANSYKDPAGFKQSLFTTLNDSQQLSNYNREYQYNGTGSLKTIVHVGMNNFTREITVHNDSNRALLKTDTFDPSPSADWEALGYFDANGNQTKFVHLVGATWNYRDNLASATIIERSSGNDDAEYYVYDASGQRIRKVKETFNFGESVKRVEEKIYLGGVEIKRIKSINTGTLVETPVFERSDLHVMDDKSRVAIANHWVLDSDNLEGDGSHVGTNKARYQYGNHLGSASLELDDAGYVISYEEYFPYGGTSIIAGNSQAEVKLKEYRYTGKERDDSTGLYYYGQRYYAPWLGRWMSADPAGPVDGLNLYEYVSGNPVRMVDPSGTQDEDMCVDQCTMEPTTVEGAQGDPLEEGIQEEFGYSGAPSEYMPTADNPEPGVIRLPETTIEGSPYAYIEPDYPEIGGSLGRGRQGEETFWAAPAGQGGVYTQEGQKQVEQTAWADLALRGLSQQPGLLANVSGQVARAAGAELQTQVDVQSVGEIGDLLLTAAAGRGNTVNPVVATKSRIGTTLSMEAAQAKAAAASAEKPTPAAGGGPSINDLSKAASAPDKAGLTKAGRALQKHGDRPGSAFTRPESGSPKALNPAGQNIVDDILKTPGSQRSPNRLGGVDVRAPDGRGIRFNADGTFHSFREPNK